MSIATLILGTIVTVAVISAMNGDDQPAAKDPFQKTFRSQKEAMDAMIAREPKAPKVGDVAPDFDLSTLDGKKRVRLSQFKSHAPVVLLFGSYT